MSLNPDKENQAVLALIAGTLHPFGGDVTEQEIGAVLSRAKPLSEEGRMALANLGDELFATIPPPLARVSASIDSGLLAAMHRDAESAELDEETQAKLEEKRQEVLERLRNRNNQPPQ